LPKIIAPKNTIKAKNGNVARKFFTGPLIPSKPSPSDGENVSNTIITGFNSKLVTYVNTEMYLYTTKYSTFVTDDLLLILT